MISVERGNGNRSFVVSAQKSEIVKWWAGLNFEPTFWLEWWSEPPHPDEFGEDPFWDDEAMAQEAAGIIKEARSAPKPVRGLKKIAPLFGVKIRAITRWLERNPHLKRHLKPRDEFVLRPKDRQSFYEAFVMSAYRAKRRIAEKKPRGSRGQFTRK